jgi:hypothetical protein
VGDANSGFLFVFRGKLAVCSKLRFLVFSFSSLRILGYVGFLEEIYTIAMNGDFFVRNKDDYYFVDISFPFFEMHWVDMNISTGESFALASKRGKIGKISQ